MVKRHRAGTGKHRANGTVERSRTLGTRGRHRQGTSVARTLANIRGQWFPAR